MAKIKRVEAEFDEDGMILNFNVEFHKGPKRKRKTKEDKEQLREWVERQIEDCKDNLEYVYEAGFSRTFP